MIMMFVGLSLFGCGSDKTVMQDNSNSSALTKNEYVGLIGKYFGLSECLDENKYFSDVSKDKHNYDAIQACAEWGIVIDEGEFNPDEEVSLEYALETAVRAIGLDNINSSTKGSSVSEGKLSDFYVENIAQIDVSDPKAVVTDGMANQILGYAVSYMQNLETEQVFTYDLIEGVTEVTNGILLKGDGQTAVITDDKSYAEGDIIYIPATMERTAQAIRINSIKDDTITYSEVGYDEVFETLNITGTYDVSVMGATPTSAGTEIAYAKPNGSIVYCSTNPIETDRQEISLIYTGEDSFELDTVSFVQENGGVTFYKEFKTEMSMETEDGSTLDTSRGGTLKVGLYNIKATVDIKKNFFGVPESAKVKLSYDDVVAMNMYGSYNATIPLGKVWLNLGGLPCDIQLSLYATVGGDGSIDITYTSDVIYSMECQPGKPIKSSISSEADLSVDAKVRLVTEATAVVDLRILGMSLVNAEVTAGVVADAKMEADLLSDEPVCVDLFMYAPLRWGVNQRNCILTDLSKKLKYSATVWDSTNSPIQAHCHYENGEVVDECTRGQGKKVEVPSVDEDGKPLDEYNLFDFESITMGYIDLHSQQMYLKKEETLYVGIKKLPENYSKQDLVYTPMEAGVCTVNSNGQVTAIGEGVTVLKISTNDGKYEIYMTIIVNEDYNNLEGFTPL